MNSILSHLWAANYCVATVVCIRICVQFDVWGIRRVVAAGRTCGTSPISPEERVPHHKLGARFFYTQTPQLLASASRHYMSLVETTPAKL